MRMEVDEKRALSHGVAGVTEGDSYCSKSTVGDRALSLFFKAWDQTDLPTYSTCSYDAASSDPNVCKELEFDYTNVDAVWFYVYSGYSSDEKETYTAFCNDDTYKAATVPELVHNSPVGALSF